MISSAKTDPAFTHLHIHSRYSLLDGVASVDYLVGRAKELGMDSLALTDHGNMFGCLEFYLAAQKAGIRPILGLEAYVAPNSRLDPVDNPSSVATALKNAPTHLVLLAENFTGYQNLCKLSTAAYLESHHFVPRIDRNLLREHARGLIGLSGCLSGKIPRLILAGDLKGAENRAREYRDIFGPDNFFLEIQRAGFVEQERILEPMRDISQRTGIPLVATSDVHYLKPEDVLLQDILLCIGTGKTFSDTKRMHGCPDLHFKSPEEMARAFPDFPDALERTRAIAARCHVTLPLPPPFVLPTFTPPAGPTGPEYFDQRCREGLRERYGDPVPSVVMECYEKAKAVITRMGLIDYFLIVWDMVNFARRNGIGMESDPSPAAGSVVCYALKITNLDPIEHHLHFERFLNGDRNEMPDIDLGFDLERRDEIHEYLVRTHGRDKCAGIATFDCLSAESGIREVGRVMGFPSTEIDELYSLINKFDSPHEGENSVTAALRSVPEIKARYDSEPAIRILLDTTAKLDGVPLEVGIHASGTVVCPQPITLYSPMMAKRDNPDEIFTQYGMNSITRMGLCKINISGRKSQR